MGQSERFLIYRRGRSDSLRRSRKGDIELRLFRSHELQTVLTCETQPCDYWSLAVRASSITHPTPVLLQFRRTDCICSIGPELRQYPKKRGPGVSCRYAR